jgi:hypothetical protein
MSSIEESKVQEPVVSDEDIDCDRNGDDYEDDCQFIFPQRLMAILCDERNSDAICWLPHGRAFIIRNRKLFAEKIMPRFFPRKSKYSSFTRKLNRWNFVRVSSGPELGAYYHEFFLRDKPQLAAQMFCKNARTKIAMATPSKPEPLQTTNATEQQMQQQKLSGGVDPAQMFLTGQGLDAQTKMLLEQQLSLCQLGLSQQQQQQKLQNPLSAMLGLIDNNMGSSANMNIFQGAGASNNTLAIQQQMQQIQAQKQQQVRMLQLQQLMALNLQRQKRRSTSNNFRASAA